MLRVQLLLSAGSFAKKMEWAMVRILALNFSSFPSRIWAILVEAKIRNKPLRLQN